MFSKRARLWLGLIAALSLLSVASSCGGPKTDDNTNTGDKGGKAYTSKGDEGTITGKVSYTGAAPEAKKIDTSADAACTAKSPNLTTEEWVVKDGKLANTYVYIKSGTLADGSKIGDWTFETPSTPALDQNGCHYKPHVLGVMVNQPITITNSDPTTHNIHFTPKNNPDWNQSQPNGAASMTHKLARAEVSGAREMQPASVDEVLRRRDEAPVLCRQRRGRQFHDQGRAAGQVHRGCMA